MADRPPAAADTDRQFTNESGTMIHICRGAVAAPGMFSYTKSMKVPADTLYEEDFYAWTQQQADLLRRLHLTGNTIDAEKVAEEIEDLGRSELRTAQSLVEHVIEHLLKIEFSGLERPAEHWRDEIVEWRLQLDKILTRSIAAKLDLASRYKSALRLVRRIERDVPGLTSRLPQTCPYSLEQIVSGEEDWIPAPRPTGS
jgi:hypothetical protein